MNPIIDLSHALIPTASDPTFKNPDSQTPHITKPEFCPNPQCLFYDPNYAAGMNWYTHFGKFFTKCRGWIQRFRCSACGKTCSTQTFSIHYWTHSTNNLVWLLHLLESSSGMRQIARDAGVSYRVIQNRIRRLARNSLSVMDVVHTYHELNEDIALDGFESYTRTQYHPNNFTTIVGSDSQFFYSVIHTLLRRKGRMRTYQMNKRALIDEVWRPPKNAIRSDCTTMLNDLSPMIHRRAVRHTPLTLFTDLHNAYPAALKRVPVLSRDVDEGRFIHFRISSRAARTRVNPLFPVNYLDQQIRHIMGEHIRETMKQGHEVNCQMERMAVFMFVYNFLTPHRIDDCADVRDSYRHAHYAGVSSDEVVKRIERFLTHRHIWGHRRVNHQWIRRIWQHEYENPPAVRKKRGRIQLRRVALPPRGLPAHFLA